MPRVYFKAEKKFRSPCTWVEDAGLRPLACQDGRFESRWGHACREYCVCACVRVCAPTVNRWKELRIRKKIKLDQTPSFFLARQLPVVRGLPIIDTLPSHSDTEQSVGLLWTNDRPDAQTSTRQHTTVPRDGHSNPQYQQASGRRPRPETARPPRSARCLYSNNNNATVVPKVMSNNFL